MLPRSARQINLRLMGRQRTAVRQMAARGPQLPWAVCSGCREFGHAPWFRRDDPFRKMEAFMRDMERKMRHPYDAPFGHYRAPFPPFNPNFWETPMNVSGDGAAPFSEAWGGAVDASEGDTFKLRFSCHQAKPEDINISLKDREVTVTVKVVREAQHSRVQHEWQHQVTLPDGVDAARLESSLAADGTLTVFAPREAPQEPQAIKVNRG